MFRLFFLLLLFIIESFAFESTNKSCVQKVRDANVIVNSSTLSIPVKNNKRLIYSPTTPNAKILKHDPFLGLYLIEDKSEFKHDFKFASPQKRAYGIVNTKEMHYGNILKAQTGLNSLGFFSKRYSASAPILDNCCSLVAIMTPEGVIAQEYLKHFLSGRVTLYGDIGVRVDEKSWGVHVIAVDPFMKNNPFRKGDMILALNGQKVKNAAEFMRKILFSKIGSKQSVRTLRGSKTLNFTLTTQERYGGGKLSDTFLESKGVYFDKKLIIATVGREFGDYGLLVGDKLLQVNGVRVETQEQLRRYLEESKEFSSFLFERRNFQFFVNIK